MWAVRDGRDRFRRNEPMNRGPQEGGFAKLGETIPWTGRGSGKNHEKSIAWPSCVARRQPHGPKKSRYFNDLKAVRRAGGMGQARENKKKYRERQRARRDPQGNQGSRHDGARRLVSRRRAQPTCAWRFPSGPCAFVARGLVALRFVLCGRRTSVVRLVYRFS